MFYYRPTPPYLNDPPLFPSIILYGLAGAVSVRTQDGVMVFFRPLWRKIKKAPDSLVPFPEFEGIYYVILKDKSHSTLHFCPYIYVYIIYLHLF